MAHRQAVEALHTLARGPERAAAEGLLLLTSERYDMSEAVREALAGGCAATGGRGPLTVRDDDLRALPRASAEDAAEGVATIAAWACARRFATAEVPAERVHVDFTPGSEAAVVRAVLEAAADGPVLDLSLRLDDEPPAVDGLVRAAADALGDDGAPDYERVRELVEEHRPAALVAGGEAAARVPDWARLRAVCDAADGCLLVAEMGRTAGLVLAGCCPSAVGHADALTFTTHGTLRGPVGAGVLTANRDLARAIRRSLPDEPPDAGRAAAMAAALLGAEGEEFEEMQGRIAACAGALREGLVAAGVACGQTDTHLCAIEAVGGGDESDEAPSAQSLARCLEGAGVIASIARGGASEAPVLDATWMATRGATDDAHEVGEAVGELLSAACVVPAAVPGGGTEARVRLDALVEARRRVRDVAGRLAGEAAREEAPEHLAAAWRDHPLFACGAVGVIEVRGPDARSVLDGAATGAVGDLSPGESAHTLLLEADGSLIGDVLVRRPAAEAEAWQVCTHAPRHERVKAWLRGLASGCVLCDEEDPSRRLTGRVTIREVCGGERALDPGVSADVEGRRRCGLPVFGTDEEEVEVSAPDAAACGELVALESAWFVGQRALEETAELPPTRERFTPPDVAAEPRETPLIEEHERLGARIIEFAGWRLPVWYTSVAEEHAAVREAAGLFDIGHMGVLELTGARVVDFLEVVGTAGVRDVRRGECRYTHVPGTDGLPLDDIIVSRLADDRFLAIVNAANAVRVTAWLQGVAAGRYLINEAAAHRRAPDGVQVRDLKAEAAGDDRLVAIALQGPVSAEVLCELAGAGQATCALVGLGRFEFTRCELAGMSAIVSRTGYTGERVGYELLVHPDHVSSAWRQILDAGEERGVLPAGLGARDSLRIEVGLPLYGHELAGAHEITSFGAGYGRFVRAEGPFFVGRRALMERERERTRQVARFRVDEEGVRAIRAGDPVASARGECVGRVTSCALAGDRQVGMAWIDRRAAAVGSALLLYPARQLDRAARGDAGELAPGDRMPVHVSATVVPRFRR